MLQRGTALLLIFVLFCNSAVAPASCEPHYKRVAKGSRAKAKNEKEKLNGVELAAGPVGFLLGSANDVLITAMGASAGFLHPSIVAALPLTNEIANIAAGSTGKRWLYSGMMKSLADNVSLGAILGQTLSMSVLHGPISGGITLAAGVGLAYWFPLTFLHPIMVGVPKMIPARFEKTKAFAESGPGQAAIGISVVGVLELLLAQTHRLAEMATWNDEEEEKKGHDKAEKSTDEQAKKAAALFLIDGFLFDKAKLTDRQRDEALVYLSGTSRNGGPFSFSSKAKLKKPDVTIDRSKAVALGRYLEKPGVKHLLTDRQRSDLKARAATLAQAT